MTAGHQGQSGRYDAWRETAWELAVLLDLVAQRDGSGPGPVASRDVVDGWVT
jgi:hypothetical protein